MGRGDCSVFLWVVVGFWRVDAALIGLGGRSVFVVGMRVCMAGGCVLFSRLV